MISGGCNKRNWGETAVETLNKDLGSYFLCQIKIRGTIGWL